MLKKLLFILILLLPTSLFAGTISFDQLAVSTDLTTTKYNSDLNRVYQKVNYDIDNTNVKADTLLETNCGDDMNPRIRTYEGASCEFVYTGLLPVTGASLTTNIASGTAYPLGYRVVKSSATPKTYTASKWTWVDIDINGDFQYSEVAIGGVTPAVAANSIRLAKVSSDATTVNTVTDLRVTSCTSGPFDIIADATGEADLGDILSQGSVTGFHNGFQVVTKDATTVNLYPGSAYINGEYRALTSNLDIPVTAASPASGTSGLDTGSIAGNTRYAVYGVADLDGVTPPTGVLSTSFSTPTGATNYLRLGEVSTDLAGTFLSADATSISYLGKIRQIKYKSTSEYITDTVPSLGNDDTVPPLSEFMFCPLEMDFTATSAENIIRVYGEMIVDPSTAGDFFAIGLFKDSNTNPVALQWAAGVYTTNIAYDFSFQALTTSTVRYKIYLGHINNLTFELNGAGGSRKFGGVGISTMNIVEYEQ